MLTKLLLRFGLCVVDLDAIARALAAAILDTHDLWTLAETGTLNELRRRYARLALETGLPLAAQRTVAAAAWRYVLRVRDETPRGDPSRDFSFYR